MLSLQRACQLISVMTRRSSSRCFHASKVASRTQNGFAGLGNCFVWDDKHGFGFDKNGEVVIVTPNANNPSSQMFNPYFYNNEPLELQEKHECESNGNHKHDKIPACPGNSPSACTCFAITNARGSNQK